MRASIEAAGMETENALDVGIVAYRCREPLRACLESLRAHPPSRPMRVIVVANDSRDGTAELVRALADVELIEPDGTSASPQRRIAPSTAVGLATSWR